MNRVEVWDSGEVFFICPGCGLGHCLPTAEGKSPRWGFNGSKDRPTLSPSILAKGVELLTEDEVAIVEQGGTVKPRPVTCHSFVREGRIEFLADSTHKLAGQTVDLPPMED